RERPCVSGQRRDPGRGIAVGQRRQQRLVVREQARVVSPLVDGGHATAGVGRERRHARPDLVDRAFGPGVLEIRNDAVKIRIRTPSTTTDFISYSFPAELMDGAWYKFGLSAKGSLPVAYFTDNTV